MAKKLASDKSPGSGTPGKPESPPSPKPPTPPPSAPGKPSPPRGGYPGPKKIPLIRGGRQMVIDVLHKRHRFVDFGHRVIDVEQALKVSGAFPGPKRPSLDVARVRMAKPRRGGFPGPKKS